MNPRQNKSLSEACSVHICSSKSEHLGDIPEQNYRRGLPCVYFRKQDLLDAHWLLQNTDRHRIRCSSLSIISHGDVNVRAPKLGKAEETILI